MCIALLSTAHPSYELILIDNRDEFLDRPTAVASWWPAPNGHVLGGRDLFRTVHGTWLGVTKHGRIAVLTNFREKGEVVGAQSRGAMVNAFLTHHGGSTEGFVKNLVASGAPQQVGGFSLVCGQIGEPLAVISNRVSSEGGISWILNQRDQTVGLSNTAFGDRSWAKIVNGEKLLTEVLSSSVREQEDEQQLLHRLLDLLSHDTLPKLEERDGTGLEAYIERLRDTIFVPVLGRDAVHEKSSSEVRAARTQEKAHVVENGQATNTPGTTGLYGTQKQTVVLVRHDDTVRFFERTLYDQDSRSHEEQGTGDVDFNFKIETLT